MELQLLRNKFGKIQISRIGALTSMTTLTVGFWHMVWHGQITNPWFMLVYPAGMCVCYLCVSISDLTAILEAWKGIHNHEEPVLQDYPDTASH
jgi:hypothetical protein